jgi:PEGA domain-containing protein
VLLAIGGGIWMLRTSSSATASRDAGVADARGADTAVDSVVVVPSDITVDADELDAFVVPVDARSVDAPHRTVPRDAATKTVRDAAVTTAQIDAPVPQAGTGTAFVTVKHRTGESFKQVLLDGRYVGDTPLYRMPITNGQHTIELVQPDTKAVVYKEVVDLQNGVAKTVVQQ